MQLTTQQYDYQELNKAFNAYHAINTRRLGADSDDDINSLIDSIPRIIDAVDWLLNGSYGYEYMLLTKQWLNDLPTTEKRRKQRLRSIAINCFMLIACLDYSDINPRKITVEFKKLGIDFESINDKIIYEIEAYMESIEIND